ncbi:hypothetical protein ACFODO_19410 [Acinetobacter sichuanensis]|uniref:Uncharacterized protein n=2 Tax=Acinetobacter sichuanensis TaxID=2136183 RepID=A0ABV7BL14_9GAMM
MSTEILNAKQAFEAMSSGQAVLCRAVGQLLDFSELSQFPATVFFGADYEFCLAPRFMTIGQLDLEVPECLQGFDDLINSAVYYAPNILDVDRPIEILSTADNATYLKRLIASKLLHKTSDDAIAHARAFITLNGGSLDTIEEVETVVEPKSTPTIIIGTPDDYFACIESKIFKTKSPEDIQKISDEINADPKLNDEDRKDLFKIMDAFHAKEEVSDPATTKIVEEKPKKTTSAEVKKRYIEALNKTTREREVFAIETQITINSDLNKRDLNSLKSMIEQLYVKFKQIEAEEINALIVQFKEQITAAQTAQELIKIRTTFASNGTLSDEQHEDLNTCFNAKLVEIDSPKNAEAEREYQENLTDLINRASQAQSPAEANALVRYTTQWTEEQRKPLINAISKRLSELNVDAQPIGQPPSLMVQIQNAPDLTTLDVLEIDVGSRHPDIQPKLMGYIRARRFELENGPDGDAQ